MNKSLLALALLAFTLPVACSGEDVPPDPLATRGGFCDAWAKNACPTTVPQATMPCEVAMCVLCNVGGNYLDSGGASKAGYCVCPMAGAAGSRKWSCASTTAWPCPLGQGC